METKTLTPPRCTLCGGYLLPCTKTPTGVHPRSYTVRLETKLTGHQLFDLVGDAFDPAVRYSWVREASWSPPMQEAFDKGSEVFDTYLDRVDANQTLVTLTMDDPNDESKTIEVPLSLNRILKAVTVLGPKSRAVQRLLAEDGDLNDSDVVLQVLAYDEAVFS